MEKRVLIAVFLSFVVLYAYQAIVPQPKRPAAPKPAPAAVTESAASPVAAPPSGATPATQTAQDVAVVEPPTTEPLVADTAERDILVDVGPVRATFSNRGAVLKGWQLTRYFDQVGTPIEMVPAGLPASAARPFTLRVSDSVQSARLNTALYRSTSPATIDGSSTPTTVTFEFDSGDGLRAKKVFRLDPESYVITFSVEVTHDNATLNPAIEWGPGPGDSMHVQGTSSSFATYVQAPQAIVYANGSVERLTAEDVAAQPQWQGDFPFAGIDDHYFIASLVRPGIVRVTYRPGSAPLPGQPALRRDMMEFEALYAKPPVNQRVFVGPKDFDVLDSVDRGVFVKSIHYGIFSFLAVPLLRSLKWIDSFVGNYGWSIIILTILINVAMFPLKHKSVVSMRRMQELQPQVKAIQDRYSKMKMTDPGRSKMNEELMGLYREKGVNPASGCVPMLLTMPVLFAFYAMLSVAVEIRGEPWAFWIKDLSQHDPYYITPLLMGATMVWQQRLTPVADPAQQKVMMLTPIIFLVMFLWAPSGLVLYWLMSNLIGIGQQYATNRLIGKPVMNAPRPPAERKVKQAGAGQSEGARGNGR
jgi:YidC/Oxa1 family membrane protein insertase